MIFCCRALFCYVKLLWITKKFQRKNLAIPDVFHETVQRHPNKPCFLFEDKTWTFQEVSLNGNRRAYEHASGALIMFLIMLINLEYLKYFCNPVKLNSYCHPVK